MDKPLDMLQIKIDRAREELPKATKKAIDSVDWRAVVLSFREKKGYSFEQLEDLELETELLLCGLLLPENYPKELEERMQLPKPQIDLLVQEMNELVFKKIKDELIRNTERESVFTRKETPINEQLRITNYELEKPTQSIPNVVATDKHITSPNIINTRESPVLSKQTTVETMPPEIPAPKTETITKNEAGVLNKAGIDIIKPITNYELPITDKKPEEKKSESLFSQKLSGIFQMPTIRTDYSLKNGQSVSPQEKKSLPKSADPYREIPE